MDTNRRCLILPSSEFDNVNWSQVLTEQNMVWFTVDKSQFFIEFDLPDYPDVYDSNTMTLYTQEEMADIFDSIEWDPKYS